MATEQNAPYGSLIPGPNWCDEDWGSEAEDDASYLDIEGWQNVYCNSTEGIESVKAVLVNQRRVLPMQTYVDQEFRFYSSGVWNYSGNSIGGHAMCIVGYDDALQAFKVRNSWGEDYGELGGYLWIGYSTFLDPAAYVRCWYLWDEYEAAVALRFCGQETPLGPPTHLAASDGTFADRIQLTWTKSDSATGYHVFRDTQTNRIATLPDTASYDDTSVADYMGHVYCVQAFNSTDNSDLSAPTIGYLAQFPAITEVSPTIGEPGEELSFHAVVYGSTPLTFAWDFGGGATPNTSDNISPLVTLAADGTYSASLTVTNEFGTDDFPFTLDILPNQPPVADLVATPEFGNPPCEVTLDASGSTDSDGTIIKYEFDFDEGAGWVDYDTTDTAQHTYTALGTYMPKVRVTDNDGAVATTQDTITVVLPVPALLAVPDLCTPEIDQLQIFFPDPVLRRNGRLIIDLVGGSVSPKDMDAYLDVLKLNGDEFTVSVSNGEAFPAVVVKETDNPALITGPDDPGAISGIIVVEHQTGRIVIDIAVITPLGSPGDPTTTYSYKFYNSDDSVLGQGTFDVSPVSIAPKMPTGINWGVNVWDRVTTEIGDQDYTYKTINGSAVESTWPDVMWFEFNGGWIFDWEQDEASVGSNLTGDNLMIFVENSGTEAEMYMELALLITGIDPSGNYIAAHVPTQLDFAHYFPGWPGILNPGDTYTLSVDDPYWLGVEFVYTDELIVIGTNPNH